MAKYSDIFTVRGFQTDPCGHASIETLCNYMNEAAGDHCIESNLTVEDLNRIGLTWMLSRLHLKIMKFPVKGDKVTVTTWPTGMRGLYSCRDFLISDSSGAPLVQGASAWLTINLERRRVVRLPDIVHTIHPELDKAEHVFMEDFKSKLPEPAAGSPSGSFGAFYSALDLNNHVTSPVYIRWMLDALPPGYMTENKIISLEISYKAEILPGSIAEIYNEINDLGSGLTEIIHAVKSAEDNIINCVARTRWQKI